MKKLFVDDHLQISLFSWGNWCTEPSVYTAQQRGRQEAEADVIVTQSGLRAGGFMM